jgi:hypothetical protein
MMHRFRAVAVAAILAAGGLASAAPGEAIFDVSKFPSASTPVDFTTGPATLSPAGQDFRQNIHLTMNGDTGCGILTYTTLSQGLWAHWFDGNTFTPGVNITIPGASKTSVIGDRVVHAFINAGCDPSDALEARDGDALIFLTAVDADGDGAGPDGANRALYQVYFDRTWAYEPMLNSGFQTVATPVSAVRDGAEENVICHGIVTDGVIGEARWLNYQYRMSYGDATSGLAVFWLQGENIDADAAVEDLAVRCALYDLNQAGPTRGRRRTRRGSRRGS